MKEQMKNQNEYRENGNLYVKKIKRCTCMSKTGDLHQILCRIHQRGEHFYLYQKDPGWIAKGPGERKLWLAEEAKNTVDEAVGKFERQVYGVRAYASRKISIADAELDVYYRPADIKTNLADLIWSPFGKCFDFLLEYRDQITGQKTTEFYRCVSFEEMLHHLSFHSRIRDCESKELLQNTKEENINQNPFIIAARNAGDALFEKQIRVAYGLADRNECAAVAEEIGLRVLPSLPEEYDRAYVIDLDTISGQDRELLSRSGYAISHMPNFGMKGRTYRKWTLNPHTKCGGDSAGTDAPSMAFCDFLELFRDDDQKEF